MKSKREHREPSIIARRDAQLSIVSRAAMPSYVPPEVPDGLDLEFESKDLSLLEPEDDSVVVSPSFNRDEVDDPFMVASEEDLLIDNFQRGTKMALSQSRGSREFFPGPKY